MFCFFFFNDTAPTEIYTLSLHDALPILVETPVAVTQVPPRQVGDVKITVAEALPSLMVGPDWQDRKSTRLNSSHLGISYAVFCLKKKKKKQQQKRTRNSQKDNISHSAL